MPWTKFKRILQPKLAQKVFVININIKNNKIHYHYFMKVVHSLPNSKRFVQDFANKVYRCALLLTVFPHGKILFNIL